MCRTGFPLPVLRPWTWHRSRDCVDIYGNSSVQAQVQFCHAGGNSPHQTSLRTTPVQVYLKGSSKQGTSGKPEYSHTLGLGKGKRVPRKMCFLRTPNCSVPLGPTTTSTFCSAALPHLPQNSRPASCTHPTSLDPDLQHLARPPQTRAHLP